MNKRLALRLAAGLFGIAILFLVYQYIRGLQDITAVLGGAKDTAGWIAAIESQGDRGSIAVAFNRDGEKITCAEFEGEVETQDIVWQPDGKFVFFAAAPEGKAFDVYRWNPETNKTEVRSFGSRAKSNLWFGPTGHPEANANALLTAGGFVLQFDPKDGTTRQVLPPRVVERGGGETGAGSQFDLLYSRLGKSFRSAKWGKDRSYIVALMIRESGEQVLILQGFEPVKGRDGQMALPPPVALASGERIDYDVSSDGKVVYSTTGFTFPDPEQIPKEFIQNGEAVKPFQNALTMYDPGAGEAGLAQMAVSPNDDACFVQPRFSPDGSAVLFQLGEVLESGEIVSKALMLAPARQAGGQAARPVVQGEAREASWSPDGARIVFVKRGPNGNRAIFTVSPDGSGQREISGDSGDFSWPQYSPIVPK